MSKLDTIIEELQFLLTDDRDADTAELLEEYIETLKLRRNLPDEPVSLIVSRREQVQFMVGCLAVISAIIFITWKLLNG